MLEAVCAGTALSSTAIGEAEGGTGVGVARPALHQGWVGQGSHAPCTRGGTGGGGRTTRTKGGMGRGGSHTLSGGGLGGRTAHSAPQTSGRAGGTHTHQPPPGMATKLMQDMGLLKQRLGSIICCAAMIDDVASLILLAIISSAALDSSKAKCGGGGHESPAWGPTEGVWSVLIPLMASLLFLAFSAAMAAATPKITGKLWPIASPPTVPGETGTAATPAGTATATPLAPSPNLWLSLLACVAVSFTLAAHYARTTYLLGAFMAGVCFASERRALEVS